MPSVLNPVCCYLHMGDTDVINIMVQFHNSCIHTPDVASELTDPFPSDESAKYQGHNDVGKEIPEGVMMDIPTPNHVMQEISEDLGQNDDGHEIPEGVMIEATVISEGVRMEFTTPNIDLQDTIIEGRKLEVRDLQIYIFRFSAFVFRNRK